MSEDAVFLNEQEDLLLSEDIVHALDASVLQSVNRALAVPLQLIARQIERYALTVPPYVMDYAHACIRKALHKDVRSCFQSERPCPDIPDKVTMPQELDPNLATFLKRSTKDSKKGIDRPWKPCQDKVVDLSVPLCRILDLAVAAKESGSQVNPDTLAGWAQHVLCLLGNANCAISIEQRKSILLRIDLKLADLARGEPGPLADGLLFGNKFIKDLGKFVHTFTALDKAQTSMNKFIWNRVFARAGRLRGRLSSRAISNSPQSSFSAPGDTFYPARARTGCVRFNRGGFKVNYSSGSNTQGKLDFICSGSTRGEDLVFPKQLVGINI
ncbi:hypothetical protein NDU88_004763 [Pleurodeles waltl]|uniref:Uncharacterized protein n=1 Tax=Pleurodeles waltl TaxID=8319 RepID=A0AAV7UG43_PLEWA|nr:hypothetical protein NDU88_004763 [Pleurodeles waltl]